MDVKARLAYCKTFDGCCIVHSMSTAPEHIAARLAVAGEVLSLMGRHRVSQTKLGKHLDLSQPALSKRLNGTQPFSADELIAIAAYFDVEVTALFSGVEQGKSSLPCITTCPGQLELALAA